MTSIIVILISLIVIIILLIYTIKDQLKRSQLDWATLDYLEEKCKKIKTKKEIEEFHKEFVEKANNIRNQFIRPRLMKIDGYVRGLYVNCDKNE